MRVARVLRVFLLALALVGFARALLRCESRRSLALLSQLLCELGRRLHHRV